MREAELLLLIVAGIYLVECATWLRRGMVCLATHATSRWKVKFPSSLAGNLDGGLVFGFPLPPLGRQLICQPWPVSISPEGVYGYVASGVDPHSRGAHTGELFSFNEIRGVAAQGSDIWVNGKLLVKVGSALLADQLANLLNQLRGLAPDKRSARLDEALESAMDDVRLRARLEELERHGATLHSTCNLLFLYLFGTASLLVWWPGYWRNWPYVLATLILLLLVVFWQFRRAFTALYPTIAARRRQHLTMMICSPPAAIRAHTTLCRELAADFHPLVVAQVLLPPDQFASLARRVVLDLVHPRLPVTPSEEPAPKEIEAWYRQHLTRSADAVVRRAGLDFQELLAPPQAEESQCRSFCPRCRSQFTFTEGQCEACGGLELVPIPIHDAVAT